MVTQHSIVDREKHSIRILLAEDNAISQKLACSMLRKAGYKVTLAEIGKDAAAVYLLKPNHYDLIFMDVKMPVMNGREATEFIRSKGYTKIPIIAVTADAMKGDREKCLAAGMSDYITKPIKRERVFEMVKKWCLN